MKKIGLFLALTPLLYNLTMYQSSHDVEKEGSYGNCCLESCKLISALWGGVGISYYFSSLQSGFENTSDHIKTLSVSLGLPICGVITALKLQKHRDSKKKY